MTEAAERMKVSRVRLSELVNGSLPSNADPGTRNLPRSAKKFGSP